jgi:multidrug efflux pump subunit AcrB
LAQELAGRLGRSKKLTDVWADRVSGSHPQLFVDVDRAASRQHGVALKDVFNTLQIYLGALDVNDFNQFGRTWRVQVQADPRFRQRGEQLRRLLVRNARGEMVPLGRLVSVRQVDGPLAVDRLDGKPMVQITANPAPGVSLAQARAFCEAQAARLPAHYRLTWLREMPASE